MKAIAIFLGVVFSLCLAALIGVGLLWMSCNNNEISLRNSIMAQQKTNEASFDTMWKILQNKAGVVEKYKDDFKSIWPDLIAGRYAQGGQLMKWVQEKNPNFDSSLYNSLMVSIEAERKYFLTEQKKLLDLQKAHRDALQKFPSSVFVGGRPPIEVTVVTSGKTTETFKTGEDNDADIFKK